MDQLDAITLLYLSKNWSGKGSLLDCAHTFQQTKADLEAALKDEQGKPLQKHLSDGSFTF